MDMHISNRHSTAVLNDVTQPIDEYGKNVTHSNNTRVFQPKLIVTERSKKQYGPMYVNALREALFTHFEKPYKAPEVPLSIIQEGDNVSKYICRQCKDCFHHQSSLEEHTFRGSWILGYWCTDCFQECEHLSGKKLYCAKCIKLRIQKFKALQVRGLKKRNDPGIVKIFFNPCQLLEHMQMHNSEDIAVNQLMLLPFPSGIGKEYFPHLKMISEALMDFMFLTNIHIVDWLVQNKIYKWWRMAKGDNPVANIIKRYPFEVQQIKQLLSCNNKDNQRSKCSLNISNVSIYDNKKNNVKNTANLLDKNKHRSSVSSSNLMRLNTSETDDANNIQSNNDIAFIDCGPCDSEQSYSTDKQLFDSSNNVKDLSNLTNTAEVGTNQNKISSIKGKISVKKFAKVPPSPVRSNNAKNASPTAACLSRVNATANHRVVTIRSTKPVNLSSIMKNFPQIADKVANKKIVFVHKNLPKNVNLTNLNDSLNNEGQNVGFFSNGSSKEQNIENQQIIRAHKLQQSDLLQTKLDSSSGGSKSKPVIKPVSQQNIKNNSKAKTKVIKKVYRPIKPKQNQKKNIQQKLNIENSNLYKATLRSSTRRILEQFFHENELMFLTIKRNEKSGKNFLSVTNNNDCSTDDAFIYRTKFFSSISKMSRSKIYVRINHIKAMSRKFSEKVGFNNEIIKEHQKLISILDNIATNSDSSNQFVDDYFGPLVNASSGEICPVCHKLIKSEEYIVGFTNVVTDSDYCLCYDFICYKCNTFQGNKERLEAHLRYHNIESPFICPECNVTFSSFQSLNVHVWTECFHPLIMRFLSCNICEIGGFCSLESIINHFVIMHSVKLAACNACCMVFEYKRFCISHMKKGHSESANFNKPLLLTFCQLDDKAIPIECYNLHMQNHKCVQESYFYNCNLCSGNSKLFITKELIKTHIYKCHYSELSSFIDAASLREILLRNDIQQIFEENSTTNKLDTNLAINYESETMQSIQRLDTNDSIPELTHSSSSQNISIKTKNINPETTNVNENKLIYNSKISKNSFKKTKNTRKKSNNPVDPKEDALSNDNPKFNHNNKSSYLELCKQLNLNSSDIELMTSVDGENLNTIETRNIENIIPDKPKNIDQYHHNTNNDLIETSEKTFVSSQSYKLKDKLNNTEQNQDTPLDDNSETPLNSDLCVDSVLKETSEKTFVGSQKSELNIATNDSQLANEENVSFSDITDDNNIRNVNCKETSETSDNIDSVRENISPLISEEWNTISRIILGSDKPKQINVCDSVKENNHCDKSDSLKESYETSIMEISSAHDLKDNKQCKDTTKISNNITSDCESVDLDKSVVNSIELFDVHQKEKSGNINSMNLKPNNEEHLKDLLAEKEIEKDYSLLTIEDDTQNFSNCSKNNSDPLQIHQLKSDKSRESHVLTLDEESEKNGLKKISLVPLKEQDSCVVKNSLSDKVDMQKSIEYSTSDDASKIDESCKILNDSVSIKNNDTRLFISQTHDYIAKHNYVEIDNKSGNIENTSSSPNIVNKNKENSDNTNTILQELTYECGSNKEIQKGIDSLKLTVNLQTEKTESEFMSSKTDSMTETQSVKENLTNTDNSIELQDDRMHIINQCKQILNEPVESSEIIITDMNNSNSLTNDIKNTKKQTLIYEAVEEQVHERNHITGNEEFTNENIKSILLVNDGTTIDNETGKESLNKDTKSHVKHHDNNFPVTLPIENCNTLQCINAEQEVNIGMVDEDHVNSLMEQRSLSGSDRNEESEESLETNELLVAGSTIFDQCMSLDKMNNDLKNKDKIVNTAVEKILVSGRDISPEREHFEEINDSVTIAEINEVEQCNDKKYLMKQNELSGIEKFERSLIKDISELKIINQMNELSTIQENNLLEQCVVEESQLNINSSPIKDLAMHTLTDKMSVTGIKRNKHIKKVNEKLDKIHQCFVEKNQINSKSSSDNEKLEHNLIEEMLTSDKNVEEHEHFEENTELETILESNELEQPFDREDQTSAKSSSDNDKREHTSIEKLTILNKDIAEECTNFEEITESVNILESNEAEQLFDEINSKSLSDNEILENDLIVKVPVLDSNIIKECKNYEEIKKSVTIEKNEEIRQCISAEIQTDDKSTPDIEKVVHSFIEEIAASNQDITSEIENFEGIDDSIIIEESNKVDQCFADKEYTNQKCFKDSENIGYLTITEMSVSDQNVTEVCENFEEVIECVTTFESKLDKSFDKENQTNGESSPDNKKAENSLNEEFSASTKDITKEYENSKNNDDLIAIEENVELDQAFDKEDQTIEHSLIEEMLEAGRAVKEFDNVEKINELETLEKGNESDQSHGAGHQIVDTNLTSEEEKIQLAVDKNLSDRGISEENENIKINNDGMGVECVDQSIRESHVNSEQNSENISFEEKMTELEGRSNNCITSKSSIDNEEISNLTDDSFENSNLLNIDQLTVAVNHESITNNKNEAVLETAKESNNKDLIIPSSIKVKITTDKINVNTLPGHFVPENLTSEENKMAVKDLTLKTQNSSGSSKESNKAQNIKNTESADSESNEISIHKKQIYIKNNINESVDNSYLSSNVSSSAEASPAVESKIISEDSSSLDLVISVEQPIEKTNAFIHEMDDSSSTDVLHDVKEKKDVSMSEDVIKCNEYELKNLSLTDDEKINLSKNSISLEFQVENSVVNVKRLRSRSSNRLSNSSSEVIKSKRKCKIKATTQLGKGQNLTEKNLKKSRLEKNIVNSVDTLVEENELVKTQKVEIRKTRSKSKIRRDEYLKNSNVNLDNKSVSSDAEEAKAIRRNLKRNRSENISNTDQYDKKNKLKQSLLMQMPTLRLIKTPTRSSPVDFSALPEKVPKLRAVKKYKIGFDNSTHVLNKVYKFKCHLCGDAISTSWSVVSDHYNKKHAHNYELCIISPKLTRLSDEDINRNKRKTDKKRKSSEASLANLKKRKRLSPKKVNEKIWISSDRTSGLFVQLESVIDGEGHFKCKKCDERCINMAELRQHISDSHRIAKKNLICLECGENFVVSPSLQMHLKAFHGIEDPVAYMNKYPTYAPDIDDFEADAKTTAANQCHVCMAVFKDKLSVDKHLRVHGMAFLSKKRREARNAQISKVEKFDKDQYNSSTARVSQETYRNKATSSSNADKASSSISSR
ncbi:uncharacterized protein PF11_0213 [Nasonia vitripennis]|uniref:C2H2-type domain-containing protein n=1 Tax=Nasonia vitripennis TaxID=7425 RepID=A0A7M7Q745_NASVI|nr:uncharacterized protein PF11_0213 [Nasonia vitripennis]XP_031781801.1 uncharacterized protein PF11_0213 [Nasonia vitripennis]